MEFTLKAHRVNKGWTRKTLAEKLDVSVNTVQNWENFKTSPDVNMAKKLSEIFDVPVDDIKFKNE